MDLKIGIAHSAQVVDVELPDDVDRAELKSRIEAALGSVDNGAVLWVTDKRGAEVAVPADRVSFVQLGSDDDDSRRIGFGA